MIPIEIRNKCASLLTLALGHNDPEKLMFFIRLEGHVNWFEVEASTEHYRIKVYNRKVYLEKGEDGWEDVMSGLDGIEADMKKLIAGQFSYEIKTKFEQEVAA